jgi:hypothetical protein
VKVLKQHPRKLSFGMQADFKLKRQNMFLKNWPSPGYITIGYEQ